MKLLLDTHLLLWAAGDPDKLSAPARSLLEDLGNRLIFSSASVWETAIKFRLQRPDFSIDPYRLHQGLLANGYDELPITGEHAVATIKLPPIHKDPFDRMLIAQASVEGLILLTSDAEMGRYPGAIRVV